MTYSYQTNVRRNVSVVACGVMMGSFMGGLMVGVALAFLIVHFVA